MRGLVLEGGGAKGSYHCGAIKALYENGYSFDGVAGTSIGAINGAIVAQDNNVSTLLDLWTNLQPSDVIDIDDEQLAKLNNKKFDKATIKYMASKAFHTLKNLGLPTDKIIPFLKKYIDEDKVRASGRDYALVTYSISERKPLELFLEDIPYGHLHEYIFASAYFPLFKFNRIQGKYYMDGGVYDNLPLNTLGNKGYDEIVAIRTNMDKNKHYRPLENKNVKLIMIEPHEYLGKAANMNLEKIAYNMKLGYYDAIRVIKDYKGLHYYFPTLDYDDIRNFLINLSEKTIQDIKILLKLPSITSKWGVINAIYYFTKGDNVVCDNEESFVRFLEIYAKKYGVERFCYYTFNEFLDVLQKTYIELNANKEVTTKEDLLFNMIMSMEEQ
ncbi:MAG: patatin-like phospholipase family protein [Clostridia bacterium]